MIKPLIIIFLLFFTNIYSDENISTEDSINKLTDCIISKKVRKLDANNETQTIDNSEIVPSKKDSFCNKENLNKYLINLYNSDKNTYHNYIYMLYLLVLFILFYILYILNTKIKDLQYKLNKSIETIHDILESNSSRDINQEFYQKFMNLEARQFGVEESLQNILTKTDYEKQMETIQDSSELERSLPFFMIYPNKNGVFPQNAKRKTKENTTYIFYPINDKQSEFEISYDSEMLGRILNSEEAYIKPACESMNSLDFSALQITNIQKGIAVKDGNSWKVIKKAIIRYD